MTANLKPYRKMRHSGLAWLGEAPGHWRTRRIKTIFREKDERNDDGRRPLLSLTRAMGLLPQSEASSRLAGTADLSKYKVCRPGELVMNRMQAWSGMFAVSPLEGLVSPDYSVFETSEPCEIGYFAYLFKTPGVVDQFARASKGIGSGFNRLYTPDFGAVPILVPPLSEQTAIVRYLDYMDRRIRRYIRAKRRLIKLLEEEKQVIIHRAVTGQIDVRTGEPYPAYKPSGVEWLGDVPEHWKFSRGKNYFREVDVRSATGQEELLSVSHITGVTPRSQKNITMFKAESYVGSKICRRGQIAVNTMWAWMAAIGVSKYHGLVSPSYHTYEQLGEDCFVDEYLDLLLRTKMYKNFYTINSSGITTSRLRLYPDDFLNIRFLCPPRREQEAILERLHDTTADTDAAIGRANREIELLHEYCTRLIADVVTGKLDVREAAANLPEEPGGEPLVDEEPGQGEMEEVELGIDEAAPRDVEAWTT
ncbi:MAG TPA: hypothetical protein VKA63_06295 [Candidatus Krumholzibacteria bacterium]|nr:hypothetical protein [Candidatus Krumholzibacteria bacterium]